MGGNRTWELKPEEDWVFHEVESSNNPKYTCQKCRNKIPVVDLEAVFHEQLRDFLLSDDELESYLAGGQVQVKEKQDQIDILTK